MAAARRAAESRAANRMWFFIFIGLGLVMSPCIVLTFISTIRTALRPEVKFPDNELQRRAAQERAEREARRQKP